MGANGFVEYQLLSMSDGSHRELSSEAPLALVISVRNLVRFVMWLGH